MIYLIGSILMIASLQSVFLLPVTICAWCKPKNRGAELIANPGNISHGICPRHLKKLKLESQKRKDTSYPAQTMVARSRQRRAIFNHPELNYQS